MRINILGCGWLGGAVGHFLQQSGHRIGGSTRHPEKCTQLQSKGIHPYIIKLTPYLVGKELGDFFDADVLIISIPPKRKLGNHENYLLQMEQIQHEVELSNISKIVFISSTSVYPNLGKEVFEEDTQEDSPLAKAENLFMSLDRQVTVIRFGGLVGPDRHPGRFLSAKRVAGLGRAPINMIHQKDCVAIIDKIINENHWNKIYNACASQHPLKIDFYSQACTVLGLPLPLFEEGDVAFKVVNNDKLKRELNYTFQYDDPMEMFTDI